MRVQLRVGPDQRRGFFSRARGDKPLADALDWTASALERSLLEDSNQMRAFSMDSEGIRDGDQQALQRVCTFTHAARNRMLRIYDDWFETLNIGDLL